MRSLLISHCDLDGMGSPIVAICMNLGFTDIECHDYHFDLEEGVLDHLRTYDKIIVADLTLNESTHRTLLAEGKIVEVYDHHDNEETGYVKNLPGSVLDHERCGTKIFFEDYACKQKSRYPALLGDFVELINTYDLWKEDSPLWEEAFSLNRVLYKYTNYNEKTDKLKAARDFVDEQIKKIFSGAEKWFWTTYEAQAIESAKEMESVRLNQALDTMTFRIDRRGNQFGAFVLPGKISYVASKILGKYDFLDYCFICNNYRSLTGKVSARSNRGFDCTNLASVNGHAAAAGGLITPAEAKLFLSDINQVPIYKDDPEFIVNENVKIIFYDQKEAINKNI